MPATDSKPQAPLMTPYPTGLTRPHPPSCSLAWALEAGPHCPHSQTLGLNSPNFKSWHCCETLSRSLGLSFLICTMGLPGRGPGRMKRDNEQMPSAWFGP